MKGKELKHLREMRETHTLLEIAIGQHYSTSLNSDEIDNFTYLGCEDTNLPCPIMVDSNMEFSKNKHELCLYVIQKSPNNPNEIVPITICEEPKIIGEIANPDVYISFVKRNFHALCAYAYRKIDSFDFYNAIDDTKDSFR